MGFDNFPTRSATRASSEDKENIWFFQGTLVPSRSRPLRQVVRKSCALENVRPCGKPIFSCVSSWACVCWFSHGKEAKNYVSVEIMLNFPLWILRGGTSIRNSGRSYTLNLYDHHWLSIDDTHAHSSAWENADFMRKTLCHVDVLMLLLLMIVKYISGPSYSGTALYN